jgi:hypothetical protein
MQLLEQFLYAQTTGLYTFLVVDEDGVPVDSAQVTSLTLTYYDVLSGAIINGRDNQDVLNTNDVTLVTDPGPPLVTTVTWSLQRADTLCLWPAFAWEQHGMIWRWTWSGGTRASALQRAIGIQALPYLPVLA